MKLDLRNDEGTAVLLASTERPALKPGEVSIFVKQGDTWAETYLFVDEVVQVRDFLTSVIEKKENA